MVKRAEVMIPCPACAGFNPLVVKESTKVKPVGASKSMKIFVVSTNNYTVEVTLAPFTSAVTEMFDCT